MGCFAIVQQPNISPRNGLEVLKKAEVEGYVAQEAISGRGRANGAALEVEKKALRH